MCAPLSCANESANTAALAASAEKSVAYTMVRKTSGPSGGSFACGPTVSTGQAELRISSSAVEPTTSRSSPHRECVPATIRSVSCSRASFSSAACGRWPSGSEVCASMPARHEVLLQRSRLSSLMCWRSLTGSAEDRFHVGRHHRGIEDVRDLDAGAEVQRQRLRIGGALSDAEEKSDASRMFLTETDTRCRTGMLTPRSLSAAALNAGYGA